MVQPREQLSRLLKALQRRLNERRGAVRRTEEAVGVSPGYFRAQRNRRKGASLLPLLKALDFINAHPRELFVEAFHPHNNPIRDLRRETHSLGTKPPRLVTDILRRANKPAVLPKLAATYLRELDSLHYADARLVRDQAIAAVRHIPRSLLPRLLGVYASALRLLEKHNGAQHALTTGLELAMAQDDVSTIGDLWQRFAFVVADSGNYQRALAISERAERIHVRVGDDIAIGKTLIDQGIWLYYLDWPLESIELHLAALPRLLHDPQLRRSRATALQTLGFNYLKLQDLDRAEAYAAQARQEASELGPWVFGGILWLQADIATARGRYEEAEGFFREAVEIFSPTSAGQAALASIELVRSLLLQGRDREAHETAKAMARLVELLHRKKNRVAEAALTELIRCGLERRGLSLALLDSTAQKIRKSRKKKRYCGR